MHRIFLIFGELKTLFSHTMAYKGLNHIANTAMRLNLRFNSIQSITVMEGVKIYKVQYVDLSNNRSTNLRPELLIAPNLRSLNLENNHLVSLEEVSHYLWGSSLPKHEYTAIRLRQNLPRLAHDAREKWRCSSSFPVWG